MITQEELKEVLRYDSNTGFFYWLINANREAKINQRAGTLNNTGYEAIGILSSNYLSHRLAWLYTYGKFPIEYIDHIDGDKLNNKLTNLREASSSENAHNQKKRCTNTSGVKGVHWTKYRSRWVVRCQFNGKRVFGGTYKTLEEASLAYNNLAKSLHGEFYKDTTKGK